MYFYPWGTHISWATPSALLLTGAFTQRPHSLGLLKVPYFLSSVYVCHPKTPFLCVKTPQIFNVHVTKRPIFTENSLIFVTKRPLFLVNFVTERPLFFKCLMYVTLYKLCTPGISPPLSIISQSGSCLGLSCRVNNQAVRAPSRLHAKPSASTTLAYA